jgi:predicted nucleotidyltransferase
VLSREIFGAPLTDGKRAFIPKILVRRKERRDSVFLAFWIKKGNSLSPFSLEDLFRKKVEFITNGNLSPYIQPYVEKEVRWYEA